MRTTLTIDEDVAEKAKMAARTLGRPFKQVVNEALRIGLAQVAQPAKVKPYRTRPHPMGLRPGLSLVNIQELLAQGEGEDAR